ncbi:MAG: hypothetical protein ACRD29_03295 [Acidimicrobiales bacterium]
MSHHWWTLAERHDRDHASDRFSRYGAYLADRIEQAVADDDLRDAATWTAWCWHVATHPVMAPPYVQEADPIERTRLWRDPDGRGLAVGLVAAAPPPPGMGRRWRTWHVDMRQRLTYGADPRALTRIEFESILREPANGWIAPPDQLPCERRLLVGSAKEAVGRAAAALNHEYGAPLASLARGLGLSRDQGIGLTRP